jgi:carboxypeptidase C (cathepsin A)
LPEKCKFFQDCKIEEEQPVSEEEQKPKEKQADESKEKKRKLLGIEPVETRHELTLKDRTIKYITRAGAIPLKDDLDETEAEIFFTAYDLDGIEDRGVRPLVFVFNGGPGSSSIWLHMGALGPWRVRMQPAGWMPAPPYRLEANPYTWLDQADLVFIDPVGTGFSRAAKAELDQKFWSFRGDIESVGEFIRLYLTRYQRWSSPLFLAGESYGTTRAAGLAGHLVEQGITFNGIILISTALNLRPIFFEQGDDLPFQLFVPTYAATAWYHQKLGANLQQRPLPDLLAEVEAWSESELTVALMKGDRLDEVERRAVAGTLSVYTGLDLDYVLGSNLRIDIFRFCKELLRSDKRSVGRLDSRFKGVEALAVTERPEFDPSILAITPPYTATFNDYVRAELGIETDMTYEVLSRKVNETWEWEKGSLPTTGEALRGAMARNPFMKVFVGQGYYDLATPHFATAYMINHMNIDPDLRSNVAMATYEAGHMFYLDVASLAAFKADVDEFIQASI